MSCTAPGHIQSLVRDIQPAVQATKGEPGDAADLAIAENARLIGYFDDLVSTDANHTYKPDPRAYQLGMDRLHLEKQDILFVAFGGWDAAGAKAFGYPTFWVNRFNQPLEELSVSPDQTSTNLDGLLNFVLNQDYAGGP